MCTGLLRVEGGTRDPRTDSTNQKAKRKHSINTIGCCCFLKIEHGKTKQRNRPVFASHLLTERVFDNIMRTTKRLTKETDAAIIAAPVVCKAFFNFDRCEKT